VRNHALQHEDRIVITDHCDVNSTYLYSYARLQFVWRNNSLTGATSNHRCVMTDELAINCNYVCFRTGTQQFSAPSLVSNSSCVLCSVQLHVYCLGRANLLVRCRFVQLSITRGWG